MRRSLRDMDSGTASNYWGICRSRPSPPKCSDRRHSFFRACASLEARWCSRRWLARYRASWSTTAVPESSSRTRRASSYRRNRVRLSSRRYRVPWKLSQIRRTVADAWGRLPRSPCGARTSGRPRPNGWPRSIARRCRSRGSVSRAKPLEVVTAMNVVDRKKFVEAYRTTIAASSFFEGQEYYRIYEDRYYNTMRHILRATAGRLPQRLLEVGGGQMSLLFKRLYGTRCTVLDVSADYAAALTGRDIEFAVCDLLRDDVTTAVRGAQFDLIVLCEVVEHLLAPLHAVLRPFVGRLDIDGTLFLTTPNFNSLRNCVRVLTGQRIVCDWFYQARGRSTGHVLEFEHGHLRWQLEQSGLDHVTVDYAQLINAGATLSTRVLRKLAAPLLLRRRWRDNLVAFGRRKRELVPELTDTVRAHLELADSGSRLILDAS